VGGEVEMFAYDIHVVTLCFKIKCCYISVNGLTKFGMQKFVPVFKCHEVKTFGEVKQAFLYV
jgi:hypothetical protein